MSNFIIVCVLLASCTWTALHLVLAMILRIRWLLSDEFNDYMDAVLNCMVSEYYRLKMFFSSIGAPVCLSIYMAAAINSQSFWL